MRKLAIFAEGHSEILFARRLIEEVAGASRVVIEHRRILGGSTVPRRSEVIEAASEVSDQKYYVLLVDCGGDHQVKTRVLEEHEGLTRQGFEKIIGIRDVRPNFQHGDIPRLKLGLLTYVRTSLAPVDFVLAVMEIESWFMAEHLHFQQIDSQITVGAIAESLGIDVVNDDLSLLGEPANDLNNCYALGGKTYQKSTVSETVAALDVSHVYLDVQKRVPEMGRLVAHIEEFLS